MGKTETTRCRQLLTDDDIRLWRTAMREVRPLSGSALGPAPQENAAPEPSSSVGKETRGSAAASQAAPPPPPSPAGLPALKHGTTPGLDKRRAERLRRGKLAVEGRIDLHGMTQDAARRALDSFVASSYASERRVLLIITGKGVRPNASRREDAVGILRQAVPRWLNERPNRERVLAFTHAQPKDGGTGALYVLLRRKRERS